MSTILNFYLEKYGLLDDKPEIKSYQHTDKAKKRWDNLRDNIRNVSELVSLSDLKGSQIKHGIKFVKRIELESVIEQADLSSVNSNFIILDGKCIRFIDDEGRYRDVTPYSQIPCSFNRLLFVEDFSRIIAWTQGKTELFMLDSNFNLIDSVPPTFIESPIYAICLNKDRNEIISSHENGMKIWKFRYANKNILPAANIDLNLTLSPNEHVQNPFIPSIYTIERTKSKHQKLFFAYGTGVVCVNLTNASIVREFQDLHERPITSLIFFNPLKQLVSGCLDGTIKVWQVTNEMGSDLELKNVFMGHNARVSQMKLFPGECQATIVTSGDDKMMRVWNLELGDEVEQVELEYSPAIICSDISNPTFLSIHTHHIDVWQHDHVYNDFMTLPVPINRSELIFGRSDWLLSYSKFGLVVVSEATNPERIIQKTNVIGSSTSSGRVCLLACFYDDRFKFLYVLLKENQVQIYNTKTTPMLPSHSFTIETDDNKNNQEIITMVGYTGKIVTGGKNSQTKWRTFLFMAHKNGNLVVMEPKFESGIKESIVDLTKIQTISLAHEGDICYLLANQKTGNLFSASSLDKTICVWRIYPFAAEPLSKVLTFYCGLIPTNMANIKRYLFTSFENEESAHFPTVVYDIENNNRFDHSPSDDHSQPIIAVSAAEKMNLFLSASSYGLGVIKIWTRRNVLLRDINLNMPINTALFCTEKADILIGLSRQLCWISHTKFLPKVYMKKQVLLDFNFEEDEDSFDKGKISEIIDLDQSEIDKHFSIEQQNILKGIKTVFRYKNYVDVLSEEEAKEVAEKEAHLLETKAHLQAINADIENIKNGEHKVVKDRYKKFYEQPDKEKVFKEYMKQFIQFNEVKLPDIKEIPKVEEIDKQRTEKHTKYVEPGAVGFFPGPHLAEKMMVGDKINPSGYIPNSSIVKLLWPEKLLKDAESSKPTLTSFDKLRQSLAKQLAKLKEEEEASSQNTRYFDWGSDEETEKLDILESPKQSEDKPSSPESKPELNKFKLALDEPIIVQEEVIIKEPSLPVEEPIKKERKVKTTITAESLRKPSPIKRESKTMPEIQKTVRFEEPAPTPELPPVEFKLEREVSMDIKESPMMGAMERESTFFMTELNQHPPTPLLVLPGFLATFVDDPWFNRLCPPPYNDDSCLKALPKPLTEESFIKHLLKHIKSSSNYHDNKGMTEAIYTLYTKDLISRQQLGNVASQLEIKINEIDKLDSEDVLEFFKTTLKFIASLDKVISDKGLVLICLSRYFDSDIDLRSFIKSILGHIGLDDTEYSLLEKELDTFKQYTSQPGVQRIKELLKLTGEWLTKWYQAMSTFAEDCRQKLLPEISKIETTKSPQSMPKETRRLLDQIRQIFRLEIHSGYDLVCLFPQEKTSRSVLNYVNVLNYFLFKSSRKKQRSFVMKTADEDTEETKQLGPKKTIVALPRIDPNKQCLVRLGESNADVLEKKKGDGNVMEAMWMKNVIIDRTLHPSLQPYNHYQLSVGGGFVPYLHLPLKRSVINPFPHPDDELEWNAANQNESMFKNRSKMFIQQFSLPPEPF